MDLSLSIVLPVHNAQNTLARDIHRLLELLPDITSRFEILIVDDASTDQTEEIAHELALQYPQLRVARQQSRQGQTAAVQTAVTLTTGDVLFVQEEGTEIHEAEIRRLWKLRYDKQLVMARAEMPRKTLSPHLLDRLAKWGEQLQDAHAQQGGIQMIRRTAMEDLDRSGSRSQAVQVTQVAEPPSPGPQMSGPKSPTILGAGNVRDAATR